MAIDTASGEPSRRVPFSQPRFVVRDRHLMLAGLALALIVAIAGRWAWNGSWHRPEVRTSMINIRSMATALESFRLGPGGRYPRSEDWSDASTLGPELTADSLPPGVSELPARDGWGFPLEYRSDGASYQLRSLGRDGVANPSSRFCGEMISLDDEMLFGDGSFITFPPGAVY